MKNKYMVDKSVYQKDLINVKKCDCWSNILWGGIFILRHKNNLFMPEENTKQ